MQRCDYRQEFIRKPKRVSALGSTRITQVTIGGWHCLALGEQGDVYAWVGIPSTPKFESE